MWGENDQGRIEVVVGGMFSGKTEELLRRVKRAQIARQKVQLFKPKIDNRYSEDHIQSHNSNKMQSIVISSSQDILSRVDDNTRVVAIDEAQFFDEGIVDACQTLAYRGKRVILAGLDLDYRGKPFGPIPDLLAVAESVTKLAAVCVICGNPATRSQLVHAKADSSDLDDENPIVVGGQDSYEARCRFCHEPQGVRELPLFSRETTFHA